MIAVLGGGVVGAAMMGVLDIPGLTPKKHAQAPKATGEGDDKKDLPKVSKAPPLESTLKPAPKAKTGSVALDPEKGMKRVATLWNSLTTEALEKIVSDWKDPELAAVLRFMEPEKASALLARVAPARASRLSKEIQKLASISKTSLG